MPIQLPASADPLEVWSRYRTAPEYDLAIIGGGSAGYAAARTATQLGLKTIVIEGGKQVGGLCILRGCMPSKAFLESAHRWHEIKRAREFGLLVKGVSADMKSIQARKQHLIKDFARYRQKQLKRGPFEFVRANASFLDPHTLLLRKGKRNHILSAKTFIIATGSQVSQVPVPGLQETGYWTSDEALETTTIPDRLAVLGGGVIAVELGQFFARLGSRTTLLQRSNRIVRTYDPDVSKVLEKSLGKDGMDVRTGVRLIQVSKLNKGKRITYQEGEKTSHLMVDEILYALGRTPAVGALNLPAAGFDADKPFQANLSMQTAVSHIFGVGDVIGHHEVVHIAINQGELAARNVRLHLESPSLPLEQIDYRLKALVTFTDPEIASVGLSETEAKEQGVPYFTAQYPFDDHGKSMIGGHLDGFVKLIAETSRGEIIGAQIIGPHASDLIHEIIVLMNYHGTARELALLPHYHPTLAEILTYPAEEIADLVDSSKEK